MMNAVLRRVLIPSIALLILLPGIAFAQSGSTGGSIGNDDKSVSGTRDIQQSAEPERSTPRAKPAAREEQRRSAPSRAGPPVQKPPPNPEGLVRMDRQDGAISDGNCTCKRNCNSATPTSPSLIAQCMQNCARTYSGCNKGLPR